MGRTKLWKERLHLTLSEGVKARIKAALRKDEDTLSFVRKLIDHELDRREKEKR